MYHNIKELLIIDDDCCHNIVCALAFKKIFRCSGVNMICFTNSEEGVSYITRAINSEAKKTVLFLDINMPRLNGWDVLEQLEHLPRAVRKNLEVYIITASPNQYDECRASKSSLVKQYLEKPLSNHLHTIFTQHAHQLTAA